MPESQFLIGLETSFKKLTESSECRHLFHIKSMHRVLPPSPQRTVCKLVKMLKMMDGPLMIILFVRDSVMATTSMSQSCTITINSSILFLMLSTCVYNSVYRDLSCNCWPLNWYYYYGSFLSPGCYLLLQILWYVQTPHSPESMVETDMFIV